MRKYKNYSIDIDELYSNILVFKPSGDFEMDGFMSTRDAERYIDDRIREKIHRAVENGNGKVVGLWT